MLIDTCTWKLYRLAKRFVWQMCLDEKEKDISSELGIAALALTAEDYASSVQRSDDNDGGGTSRHTMTDAAAINLAERSPRFEDASGHANVTVQLGDTAFLNCKVLDLQDKTVRPSASLFTYMIDFCFLQPHWLYICSRCRGCDVTNKNFICWQSACKRTAPIRDFRFISNTPTTGDCKSSSLGLVTRAFTNVKFPSTHLASTRFDSSSQVSPLPLPFCLSMVCVFISTAVYNTLMCFM